MKQILTMVLTLGLSLTSSAEGLLIKLKNPAYPEKAAQVLSLNSQGSEVENLGFGGWIKVRSTSFQVTQGLMENLENQPEIAYVQPDYPIQLLQDYKVKDPAFQAKLKEHLAKNPELMLFGPKDNPPLPEYPINEEELGDDPDLARQWGLKDIGATQAWEKTRGSREMVVAVIDTGVDYNHEDLKPNMWMNPGETGEDSAGQDKATNGVDDDQNGYIDDIVGWDFVSDDNKPWDLYTPAWRLFLGGGNPGHGTHCAGNIAARGNNSKGIAGVAPDVKIMALRFLSERGQGETSGAVKAIAYAIKNGAMVLSNSWGSSGENPADQEGNRALREIIQAAEDANRLFVAAAGNSTYDNDSGNYSAYPASYENENIISVAAIGENDLLGSFSSFGAKSVDIAAPGVRIFSTTPGNKYSDVVANLLGLKVYWDGTSMATPHVAGAAAWYWSLHPELTALEVKQRLLDAAEPLDSLRGKVLVEGKLNLKGLN